MNILYGLKNKHYLGKACWYCHSNIYKCFALLFLSVPGRKLLKFQVWSWNCLFLILLIFAAFFEGLLLFGYIFHHCYICFCQLTLVTKKYSSLTLALSWSWNLWILNKVITTILYSLSTWCICFTSFRFQSICVSLFKGWHFYMQCAIVIF